MVPQDEVKGLPKFKLIRDFYDELVGPFVVLKPTADEQKEMVWRIEQIEDTLDSEELREEVEQIIHAARVDEARRCKNGEAFVHYKIDECTSDLLVRYSNDWKLLSYTFVADDPQPFDLSVSICDSETYETKRWEDVVDFCWMAGNNVGLFACLGENCPTFGMWTFSDENGEVFYFDLHFGLSQVFQISAETNSREKMVGCVKAFLNGGFSAAETFAGKWSADCIHSCVWNKRHGRSYDVGAELRGDYLRALRKGNSIVVRTLQAFHFNGERRRYFDDGNTDNNACFDNAWFDTAVRAFRGHKPSMRRLAAFLGKSPLANYWLRKARGLPLSTDPIPKPRRRRKPQSAEESQLTFDI